jgi:hypothetical protein
MNIVVHEDNTGYAPKSCRFSATDGNEPDSSTIGRGATESEAILDLIEIMFDECEICEDEARELMRIYGIERWHWDRISHDAR